MSLDVYLVMRGAITKEGSGVYVNDSGNIRHLTKNEWEEEFPYCQPAINPEVDVPGLLVAADFLEEHRFLDAAKSIRILLAAPKECVLDETVYSANITHNLTGMADAAGIYLACWRPGEMMALDIHTKIVEQQEKGNYHGPGGVYELEKTLPTVYASDLVAPLRSGLDKLRADPGYYETFNAANGWGLYANFVPWVQRYLDACEDYPNAEVSVSR